MDIPNNLAQFIVQVRAFSPSRGWSDWRTVDEEVPNTMRGAAAIAEQYVESRMTDPRSVLHVICIAGGIASDVTIQVFEQMRRQCRFIEASA